MKQIAQTQRNGNLRVIDVPAPALRPGGVLVRTAFSLISAGTERAKVEVARKSLVGKAIARPDQVRQVLATYRQIGLAATVQKVVSRLDSLSPLGYSSAGVVMAVGAQVDGLKPGDRVACAGGGYANHAEIVYVPRNLCVPVPDGVPLADAAYATLGAVALQGVRQAAPALGESVGVIGLGLLGLLSVQMLKANGCRVIGFDINPARCQLALRLGADATAAPDDPGADRLAQRFSPYGLDAVILTAATKSDGPVLLAGRLARDRARVVVVGAVGMNIPRSPFYEKELEVLLSRSYGPGRYDARYEEKGQDYPAGYVRWTEGRNLAAVLDLMAAGKLDVQALNTHTFPVDRAEAAYELIEGKTNQPYLGVLIDYGWVEGQPVARPEDGPVAVRPYPAADGKVGLALLGAGSFAQSMLLPHLRRNPTVRLRAVVTPSGLTARSVAERAGFELCGAQARDALQDSQVSLALIASRHDSHAELAVQALEAGKAVFVEKPLAMTRGELEQVQQAYARAPAPFLMVGFNRRFAPLVLALREFLASSGEPILAHYRVNAGFIPLQHWTQDPQEGGGRVVGEACHFVDLLMYLIGEPPVEVCAHSLPNLGRYNNDNLSALLRFRDGSVGTLTYAANGDRGLEKERLEVFSAGRAAVMDDFRQLTLAAGGRRKVRKDSPDKGHRAEMQALIEAVRLGRPEPVPFEQAVRSTLVTLAIVESLSSGQTVCLP